MTADYGTVPYSLSFTPIVTQLAHPTIRKGIVVKSHPAKSTENENQRMKFGKKKRDRYGTDTDTNHKSSGRPANVFVYTAG